MVCTAIWDVIAKLDKPIYEDFPSFIDDMDLMTIGSNIDACKGKIQDNAAALTCVNAWKDAAREINPTTVLAMYGTYRAPICSSSKKLSELDDKTLAESSDLEELEDYEEDEEEDEDESEEKDFDDEEDYEEVEEENKSVEDEESESEDNNESKGLAEVSTETSSDKRKASGIISTINPSSLS